MRPVGYAIVLVGVAVFLVGCFLPYFTSVQRPSGPSLYEMQTMRHSGVGFVGTILMLFTGVAALAVIASAGIRRPRGWTPGALVAVVIVWALDQIGFALGASGLWPTKAIGYWVVIAGVGIVTVGAAVVWAALPRDRLPARPDS